MPNGLLGAVQGDRIGRPWNKERNIHNLKIRPQCGKGCLDRGILGQDMSDSRTNQSDLVLAGDAVGMEGDPSISSKARVDLKVDLGQGTVGSANNGRERGVGREGIQANQNLTLQWTRCCGVDTALRGCRRD
jgi:hypothetical protein